MTGKAWVLKTLRMHAEEVDAIDRACEALNSVDRATFMTEAALFQAMRLGVYYSFDGPPPLRAPWPYNPARGEDATGERLTISMNVAAHELIARATSLVQTSEPLFIIGSALAYIGRLQSCFEGTDLSTPEEAAKVKKKLQAIRIPPQFEYKRRAKR